MEKIYYKSIEEINSFTKYGDTFTKVFGNDEKHIYVFKRGIDYEVVQGVKHKNPDGNIVYVYPSNEQFGVYGYYISGYVKNNALERIIFRLSQFDEEVADEFKNKNIIL